MMGDREMRHKGRKKESERWPITSTTVSVENLTNKRPFRNE